MEGNDGEDLQKQIELNNNILEKLKLQFHKNIDVEVIESVAYETGYKLEIARNCLIDIARNTAVPITNAKPKPRVRTISTGNENVNRIVTTVSRGIRVMILLRGLPGSGKSHLAHKIIKQSIGECRFSDYILSADDYFYRNGSYEYDNRFISEAHRWNQTRAHRLMCEGVSPIIIDNTHTQVWEMKPYCIWAVQYAYMIEVLEPDTSWAFNERELFNKNRHNVPRHKIRDMMDRYEKNVTVAQLFQQFDLCYGAGKLPPQPRKFPTIKVLKDEIYISDDDDSLTEDKSNTWKINAKRSWETIEDEESGGSNTNYVSIDTMTNYKDPINKSLKVIYARNTFNNVAILPPNYSRGGLLDKGTMTDEENTTKDLPLEHLACLFDNKYPLEYIVEIYEKCNNNVEWAVEILLDNNKDILENYKPPIKAKPMEIDDPVEEDFDIIEVDETSDEERKRLQTERQHLKHLIESNVVIRDEHYSDHILKLKNQDKQHISRSPKPSTSKEDNYNRSDDDDDIIIIDSDLDFEDTDDSDELVEFNLGDIFVGQLEQKFGDPTVKYPQGFQPVIEMPKSLGRQLHALYLESIFKQMDAQNAIIMNMIKEDAEFAKSLQLQGEDEQDTPNLKEIMTEQRILSKQQSVNDQWKNQTPDDIAYKMSKQKLIQSFPDIPPTDLIEILNAHGNCYKQTVEVLLQSGASLLNNLNVTELPISEETINEMREAQSFGVNDENEQECKKTADELRDEASQYHRKRQELLQKAKIYNQRKMMDVAMFYSNLASQQTQMIERTNNEAANQILTEHFNRLGDFGTLDLHYLRVAEALTALDVFLDRNINLLQSETSKNYNFLMILTGRGRNSSGGIPRIRPAVQDRLMARGLKFQFVNPGLIRTKILKNSLMTYMLKK